MLIKTDKKGVVLDVTNEGTGYLDAVYASVTAPGLTYVEIAVDGEVHDGVYVGPGSSHSWWTNAGGKLFPASGIKPGSRAVITAEGPVALRIDWIE
jgi:hypothetical protein